MNTIETLDNRPFKNLITTIGALPTSFIDSMSYYEMLAWLCDYLANQVTPAVNNNAEALVQLKEYVDNYFDSADFQAMVDAKLDEMAADGTLGALIGQYIDENYVKKTDYATDSTAGVVKVGDSLDINNGVLNTKPFQDFLQNIDLTQTRYNGHGGYTSVWYTIIPADTKPLLKLANGVVNSEDYVANTSYDNKATLAVNAGVYRIADHDTIGGLVVDGEFIQDNGGETYAQPYRQLLYMTEDGRLDVLAFDATEAQIRSVNPIWAVQGFWSLIYNYNPTSWAYTDTAYGERTVIAQDGSGNYLVFVTGGRAYYDVGFDEEDCVDFCTSVGFTPRIVYLLDGGGSSQIAYRGITMNQLAGDSGLTRKVPNCLIWASPTAKTQGIFDEALATNNAIIGERRKDISINIKPLLGKEVDNVAITAVNAWIQGDTVFVNGHFNISSGTVANYGTLITNLPLPDSSSNLEFMAFKRGGTGGTLIYLNKNNGKLNNGSGASISDGNYEINCVYKIKPSREVADNLE